MLIKHYVAASDKKYSYYRVFKYSSVTIDCDCLHKTLKLNVLAPVPVHLIFSHDCCV